MHHSLSFSPKAFINYIIEHASDTTVLLRMYYEVSIQLDILALSTRMILNHISDLDEPLCELFFVHENIGEGYIKVMDEVKLTNFFVEDGKLFLDWK